MQFKNFFTDRLNFVEWNSAKLNRIGGREVFSYPCGGKGKRLDYDDLTIKGQEGDQVVDEKGVFTR